MKRTKYITNRGLAFSEEQEMEKLSKFAKEGWLFEKFSPLGFKLRKGEKQDIQYALDYRKDPDDEYFSFFDEAGWSHVCSASNYIHVFSASKGTIPIYSDQITTIEKYRIEKENMRVVALPALLITIILFLLKVVSSYGWIPSIAGDVCMVLGLFSLVCLIFSGMPYIAYHFKLKKLLKSSLL